MYLVCVFSRTTQPPSNGRTFRASALVWRHCYTRSNLANSISTGTVATTDFHLRTYIVVFVTGYTVVLSHVDRSLPV